MVPLREAIKHYSLEQVEIEIVRCEQELKRLRAFARLMKEVENIHPEHQAVKQELLDGVDKIAHKVASQGIVPTGRRSNTGRVFRSPEYLQELRDKVIAVLREEGRPIKAGEALKRIGHANDFTLTNHKTFVALPMNKIWIKGVPIPEEQPSNGEAA